MQAVKGTDVHMHFFKIKNEIKTLLTDIAIIFQGAFSSLILYSLNISRQFQRWESHQEFFIKKTKLWYTGQLL